MRMRIRGEIARTFVTPKEQVSDNVLSVRISQAKRLLFDAALESADKATYEDTIFFAIEYRKLSGIRTELYTFQCITLSFFV